MIALNWPLPDNTRCVMWFPVTVAELHTTTAARSQFSTMLILASTAMTLTSKWAQWEPEARSVFRKVVSTFHNMLIRRSSVYAPPFSWFAQSCHALVKRRSFVWQRQFDWLKLHSRGPSRLGSSDRAGSPSSHIRSLWMHAPQPFSESRSPLTITILQGVRNGMRSPELEICLIWSNVIDPARSIDQTSLPITAHQHRR